MTEPPDTSTPTGATDPGYSRRIARSTAVFSLATAVSRVLGLMREMVSAYYFGVSGLINAFTVAIQIPNLVRALVADAALSGAFVPVFSELLERGEKKRAWRVASTLFWLTLLVLGGITALFILLAPLLMRPFGDPGGDFDLAVGLSRVLFPIVVLLGLSGIVVGILNTYHHFALPALAPVAWNLVIILGLVIGVPRIDDESGQLYLYAGVVVVGTLVQLLLPIPWLRRLDGSLTMVIDWRDPAVRRVLGLMLPVTLTIGLVNVNFLVDTLFASRLLDPELAPAAIDKAFRLYMLPQGIFAVAVTTVLFPALARMAARGDTAGLRRALDGGLRQIAFLLFPAGLLSIVLAEPIVRLVYQRGEFSADDTVIVAQCLQAFSIGLVFNGWMLILNRSFYAVQTNWTPTAIALGAVALNAGFDTIFYRLGIWGIPLATSAVNVVAATVLLVMMRRRIGLEHVGRTLTVVARVAFAAALAAAAAFLVWYGLDAWLGESLIAQLVSLGAAFSAGGLVYFGAGRALGLRELEALLLLRAQRSEPSDQR
ncbi:MAG: murein biosynthesis integral membrane protein MurJ [Thermoleophilia bacterium]|nr:murein biosynthesis integral membrane protein MurJ [Thermoleophilia bacterium]MDH4338939.1 murein biosynthesis integral membrane protein MurJ [Thermoleophilia bacterium]